MAFDGMLVYAVTQELQRSLESGRINKIYQPFQRELIFHIRAHGASHKLLLSANPTFPRIHFTEETTPNPVDAPMFCMLLRKHLEGGVILDIRQVEMDRIIHIDVQSRDELGDTTRKRLIIEIMGKHSNIILVDPEKNTILDSIHHVSHATNQYRVVLPGRAYVDPPKQHKLDPFSATEEDVTKKLNFNLGRLDQQLVEQFSGISPLLAKEILYRAGLETRENIAASFLQLLRAIRNEELDPTITTSNGRESFYLFPLQHVQGEYRSFPTVSMLLDHFFHGKAERDRVKQKANDFIKFVSNERNKNEKKLTKLRQTQEQNENAEHYKLYGELITAYMHQLKRGDSTAELVNYYDSEGATLTIPLDPRKAPNDNAQQYYKKYQKAKNSLQAIQEQIERTEQELVYFDTLLQQLDNASPKDVEEMREELIEEGYLRDRSKQKKKKKKPEAPQLERYTSSDGTEILVGKNNKQNEYLTQRLAKANETWLHTKDIPGSHVVIRSQDYSEQTLLEAAKLAAFYSKASTSSQVPVDYTLVKHVKKPSGAKPGFVIYTHQKTVFVTPSPTILEELNTPKHTS